MKAKQDWRTDPTRVIIQATIAAAGVFGAIGTVLGYLLRGSGTH